MVVHYPTPSLVTYVRPTLFSYSMPSAQTKEEWPNPIRGGGVSTGGVLELRSGPGQGRWGSVQGVGRAERAGGTSWGVV